MNPTASPIIIWTTLLLAAVLLTIIASLAVRRITAHFTAIDK